MSSQTPSRGRSLSRTRSPSPLDRRDAPRSPRRSISPRSRSHSRSVSLTPRRRRSLSHSSRSYSRSLTRSRSPSPVRSSKIVIEKLSKNVNEAHLAEIFGAYGAITNLEVPMNRQFMTNRGTAYIQYTSEADADAAIAHMHEAQLDGAVISVSIVMPRSRRSPLPPPRRGRAGGGRFAYSGRRSPVGRGGRLGRGGRNLDTYRPRSVSRSRSPRRHRSRSRSTSRSRSPPRRGGGARRRRSPSYSSYDSYDDKSRSMSRSRSRSRERGLRGRGR